MKRTVFFVALMFAVSLIVSSCGGSNGASDPKGLFAKYKEFTVDSLKGEASIEDFVGIIHFASAENKSKFLAAAKVAQDYAEETAKLGKEYADKLGIEQLNPYADNASEMFTPIFKDVKIDGDKGTIVFEMKTGFSKVENKIPILKVDGLWFISDEFTAIKKQINADAVAMEKELKSELAEQKKEMQEILKDPKKMAAMKKRSEMMKDRMKNQDMPDFNNMPEMDDDDDSEIDENNADDDEDIPTMPGIDAEAYKKYSDALAKMQAVAAKWQNDMQNPAATKEINEAKVALAEAQKALQPK